MEYFILGGFLFIIIFFFNKNMRRKNAKKEIGNLEKKLKKFWQKMEKGTYNTFDKFEKDLFNELNATYIFPKKVLEYFVDSATIYENYKEVISESLFNYDLESKEAIIEDFLQTGDMLEAIKKYNPNYKEIFKKEEKEFGRTDYSYRQQVFFLENKLRGVLDYDDDVIIDEYEAIDKVNYKERISFLKKAIKKKGNWWGFVLFFAILYGLFGGEG